MRVLQVVTHMNRGGLETMLMNYYRHIDRTKVQFDFLTHRDKRGDYDDEIEALGGNIYRLPVLNPLNPQYRKALADFFDQHSEYKVIHVHQDCMSSVILKEAKKHNVPVRIAHSHNSGQDKNMKYPIKLFYRRSIGKYATNLMACGEDAGRWMFQGADFEILNNAIDVKKYVHDEKKRKMERANLNVDEDCLLLGHVGRFCPSKNHTYLIDVFRAVCRKRKAKLLLVGDGELRAQIEEKVKRLKLTDKVIFTGVRRDVADLMQAMDIFVLPSNYEGLPVTIIEAQAAGLPCIISDQVPSECRKTKLVQQIALDEGKKVWADKIIEASQIGRMDTYEAMIDSGFDIHENAKRLQDYYLCAEAGEKVLCLY
ncbi:MAG: glycosyltransferase family 1 protein [Clostridiales bacterium]|nr:glycosyltransferase family 1 protein [Clostridiales bacterium]